jgi:protein O-GlcNAc transferase
MFLPENSVMVEILPSGLDHNGFRNMARMLGHSYYSAHADEDQEGGDWHDNDLTIPMGRFMDLIYIAIKTMYTIAETGIEM